MSETLTSPLSEVCKESLSELFQRDPLSLNEQDVHKICVELRSQREKWMRDEQTKTPRGQKSTPKVALSQAEMDDLLNKL